MRELVLSATYRQSSSGSAANAQLDEANDQFWRMNRRQLGIESWRDAIIAASLTLEGGRPLTEASMPPRITSARSTPRSAAAS
jgi:hypothetical protein